MSKARSFITLEGEKRLLIFVMVAVSLASAYIVLLTRGNILIPIAIFGIFAIAWLTMYRIDWGLYVFVGLALLFDEFSLGSVIPWTTGIGYYLPLNLLVPGLGLGIMNPMEMQLFLLFAVWILLLVVRRKTIQPSFLPIPLTLFYLSLSGALIRGGNGGDFQMGLWEVRALGHLGLVTILVPQIIRTESQIKILINICIAAISFKALQGLVRFASLGFSLGEYRTLMAHEDPVFLTLLFILLIGFLNFGVQSNQRKTLLLLFPLLLAGFYIGNRRAAYAGFAGSLMLYLGLLSKHDQKRIMKFLAAAAVVFGAYLALYWNSGGRTAMIAQGVRSTIFAHDRNEINYEDYSSGLAREQENYNTAVTVREYPLLGIGFGKKFLTAMKSWGAYAFKGYTCHNQVLWVLAKSGAIGFFLFFFFFLSAVMHGSFVFRTLENGYLKSVCAVCMVAVVNQLIVSSVDMQLTSPRNMIFLGTLIGLIPVIQRINSSIPITVPG